MSASFYDLLKYAATGIASPDMTYYDKMRASTLMGGAVQTLTGQPPLSFKADGSPLISLLMKGNGQQTGTPTPDNPVMPEFVGVRTANLVDATMYGQLAWSVGYLSMLVASPIVTLTSPEGLLTRIVWSKSTNNGERLHVGNWITPENSSTFDLALYSDADCFRIEFRNVAYSNLTDEDIALRFNIMINAGTEPLPYEPYGFKLPLTINGTEYPIYLGQTQTVRRIKKLVLTGEENWNEGASNYYIFIDVSGRGNGIPNLTALSTHTESGVVVNNNGTALFFKKSVFVHSSLTDFKSYLAAQYAAGTPVCVWYVLATPETGIVNEPIAKIGDYADELSSTDAAVTIPTAKGNNVLTIDTELQPSEMTITFKG